MDFSSLTVSQVRDFLRESDEIDAALLDVLDADPRAGVRSLALKERRRRRSAAAERARLEKMRVLESKLHARGLRLIAGVDEAGRGPLAGPVVAAAVILPPDALIHGLNDSKVLTPLKRERLYDRIQGIAVAHATGEASAEEIDRMNVLQATYLAMRRAIERLGASPDRVLVDGAGVPGSPFPESAVIDGDAASLSIAAASILAKVTRDRKMAAFHREFPVYGFADHKGYGSASHRCALRNPRSLSDPPVVLQWRAAVPPCGRRTPEDKPGCPCQPHWTGTDASAMGWQAGGERGRRHARERRLPDTLSKLPGGGRRSRSYRNEGTNPRICRSENHGRNRIRTARNPRDPQQAASDRPGREGVSPASP